MPEPSDLTSVDERIRASAPVLSALLEEAQRTWLSRAGVTGGGDARPGWRPFEDAFPTFYQFTNKPR